MITKLLDSQSFSKVWKSAVRQRFCAIASKIWPRNIICGPLREHILFAYPLQTLRTICIGYLELRLKTCDNVKSVIVWNVSFRLATRSFKNTGPNNTIFSRSKSMFWRSSSLENCDTYVALINMKHSTESKTQTGFNRTLTKYILAKDKCKRAINTRGNLVFRWRNYHPKQSLSFLSCCSFACSSTSYLAFHF